MPRPNRLKNPPIEISDNELIFTSPSSSLFRKEEKRENS